MSVAKHRLSSDIAQVDDLLLDGREIYVYARKPDDSTAILTNLRTGEEVTFAPERILAMKLIVPGAIIQTGGAPHHIVKVEDKHITFTAGDGEPQGMHALFYAETLAAVRRRNYGEPGKQTPDADDALAAELDAVADTLLDEAGVPDLDADAALTDELDEILDRPSSFGDFVRGRILSEDDLFDDELPPEAEEELPPGEPIELPEPPEYRKGDQFSPVGKYHPIYKVTFATEKHLRLTFEVGGATFDATVLKADVPKLLRPDPFTPVFHDEWDDEVVRISAELITARERIRQLEEENARLHEENRDTVPLAPETVAEAVRASQEMAQVESDPLTFKDVRTESVTLAPIDILDASERFRRDREVENFRNMSGERWYTVFEAVTVVQENNEPTRLLHTIRMERNITIDKPPADDGQPEHRDILDQAADVVNGYEPDEQPEADAAEDLVTETDLAPVPSATPIRDAIEQHGLDAVMESLDADIVAAFHKGAGMWAPRIDLGLGEASS